MQGCNKNHSLYSYVDILFCPLHLFLLFTPLRWWCEADFIQIHFGNIGTLWLPKTNVCGLMVTKLSNFQSLCVPCRAKQDVVCYYGNRGSPEPIHLKAGLWVLFFFCYGCCRNLSVHILLSSQPLALHVSLTFLFWCAPWLSVYWSIELEGHKPSLLVSFCQFWLAGIYGLSNSLLDTPWKKLLRGKRHFTTVVNDQTLSCDGLVQELLGVLNNEDLWVHMTLKPHLKLILYP